MNDTDTYLYAIDSFSASESTVYGPRELREEDAVAYLAQRLADQHGGALTPTYWINRAREILGDSARRPGVACIERVARGRGVIVTAEALSTAALFDVRVFPVFEDEHRAEEVIAAFDHPRLGVAMREAGVRAEAWARIASEEVRIAQDRGPLDGFEAEITARLSTPLLPGALPRTLGRTGRSPVHLTDAAPSAARHGCHRLPDPRPVSAASRSLAGEP